MAAGCAALAVDGRYCRPDVTDGLDFEIEGGRHVVVIAAPEHRADIVFQDLDLFAGDLRPAGVVADQGNHRSLVAHKGIKFLQTETGRPVAVNQPDFGCRMRQFGPKGKTRAHTEFN